MSNGGHDLNRDLDDYERNKNDLTRERRAFKLEQDRVKKALFDEKTLELKTRFDDITKNLNQEIEKLNIRSILHYF